jgi:ketosteroid isomerase-like protein
MTEEIAYRFIQALDALEQDGEVEPIVETFAESCEIETPVIPQRLHGKIEARAFWAGYRMAFRNIHSTFRNIVIGDNSIALEWTASCTNRSGKEFKYDGVSILDISGPRITHFRSYFDSRVMHEHMASVPLVQ